MRSSDRWNTACNALIAIGAGLTIIAPHWPWFLATLVPDLGDGCTLFMTWSYGGPIAAAAAVTSLTAAIVSPAPARSPTETGHVQAGSLPSA